MQKTTFQAAAIAAMVAFVSALVMGFGVPVPVEGISLQPSMAANTLAEFIQPANEYPELTLRFFAADSLFVLSYVMVFVGLYTITAEFAPLFAKIGLGAGILTGLFDAAENAFFIVYATQSLNGVTLTEPNLPLIYILANLKWMGAFGAMYAFGLSWPKNGRLDQLLTFLMLFFPLLGVLGVAQPGLVDLRGLFFLVGMPLFAWRFWQTSRHF
jgi:hypothetical protein